MASEGEVARGVLVFDVSISGDTVRRCIRIIRNTH